MSRDPVRLDLYCARCNADLPPGAGRVLCDLCITSRYLEHGGDPTRDDSDRAAFEHAHRPDETWVDDFNRSQRGDS